MRIPHGLRAVLASGRRDPDFKNTVLLLHGDGTNGAQNNTFIDGSSNNFTITRNGNVTQGTFSPYGDNWSNYFDGSGDYLSINYSSGSTISGDFTFETWVFETGTSAYGTIMAWRNGTSGWSGFVLQRNNNQNNISVGINGSASIIQTSGTYVKNQWNHVALVRSGSTVTLYVNGTSVGTATVSGSFNPGSSYWIGSDPFNNIAATQLGGYISNQRFVNGTALYTSNFTPPSSPLTAITNTSLLTCQSNRFIDNSSNAFAITRNGDVSVQRFSPFAPTAAYATSTIGGSGYFDGAGDYLSIADNSALELGSGAFTYEAFVYKLASGAGCILGKLDTGTPSSTAYTLEVNSSNTLIATFSNGTSNLTASDTNTFPLNQWVHVAFTRDGNTGRLYRNGTQVGTVDLTGVTNPDAATQLAIGRPGQFNGNYWNGYISNVRIVKGTCLYPGGTSFTPPAAPLTAITNTSLLCNFTNAAIIDNTMMNVLETVGNAQISTTQKKYGTGALYFDGTGDYLLLPSSPQLDFTSGDFTIEFFLYTSSLSDFTGILTKRAAEANYSPFLFETDNSAQKKMRFLTSTTGTSWITLTSSGAFPLSEWVHVAAVRSGNTITYYENGISKGSVSISGNVMSNTSPVVVGRSALSITSSAQLNGYIDDLRITKGVARYTANFTPPAAPFADF